MVVINPKSQADLNSTAILRKIQQMEQKIDRIDRNVDDIYDFLKKGRPLQ